MANVSTSSKTINNQKPHDSSPSVHLSSFVTISMMCHWGCLRHGHYSNHKVPDHKCLEQVQGKRRPLSEEIGWAHFLWGSWPLGLLKGSWVLFCWHFLSHHTSWCWQLNKPLVIVYSLPLQWIRDRDEASRSDSVEPFPGRKIPGRRLRTQVACYRLEAS